MAEDVAVGDDQYIEALNALALDAACIAESKGFWEIEGVGELGIITLKLALIHSEVSEALDEHRAAMALHPADEDDDAVEIPLYGPGGELQGYTTVDAADYDFLILWRWRLNSEGYVVRVGEIPIHRTVLGLTAEDGGVVDHINGNPLDNRRSNLRAVTIAQNLQNRKSVTGSSSVHRGVSWDRRLEKWKAQAMVEGRRYHLGYFEDETEADRIVRKFRREQMPFSREAEQLRRLREGRFMGEVADILIRTLDLCGYYGINIGEVVVDKMNKNRDRPPKHGKRY